MSKVFSKLNDSVIYSSITIHPQKSETQTPFKQAVNAVEDQLLQEQQVSPKITHLCPRLV